MRTPSRIPEVNTARPNNKRATLIALVALAVMLGAPVVAAAQQFQVVGTCADGPCGLNIRNGPGYSNYAKIGGVYDGNTVDVICQTRGQVVTPGRTPATAVWDQIVPGGAYVTDAYINTPGRGSGSFSLPRCPPSASIGSPGNGGVYNQGAVVNTSFTCTEALGVGESVASCADSNGGSGSSGTLNTSTPGAKAYTVTATSTDGATNNASISYTVIGSPSATINSPSDNGHFLQGSTVATSFQCSEGSGGPGIESCTDSNGGSGGSGTLNTSVLGSHVYAVSAKSSDGATGTAQISYSVAAAQVTCAGNSGKVSLSPGLTNTAAVQVVKVSGSLSGCTGGTFTGAKYVATLKTAHALSCTALSSAGEPALGPVLIRWLPKAKGAESNGTLNVGVTGSPGASLGGTLESGQFSTLDIAGTTTQTYTKAASCGVAVGKKAVQPVKTAKFTGSIQLY